VSAEAAARLLHGQEGGHMAALVNTVEHPSEHPARDPGVRAQEAGARAPETTGARAATIERLHRALARARLMAARGSGLAAAVSARARLFRSGGIAAPAPHARRSPGAGPEAE
jgi:hypothetical protein